MAAPAHTSFVFAVPTTSNRLSRESQARACASAVAPPGSSERRPARRRRRRRLKDAIAPRRSAQAADATAVRRCVAREAQRVVDGAKVWRERVLRFLHSIDAKAAMATLSNTRVRVCKKFSSSYLLFLSMRSLASFLRIARSFFRLVLFAPRKESHHNHRRRRQVARKQQARATPISAKKRRRRAENLHFYCLYTHTPTCARKSPQLDQQNENRLSQ